MSRYAKPEISQTEIDAVFSDKYRVLWNSTVQKSIDENIEKHRKADACFQLPADAAGKTVKVQQISHDFIFGAHIFNFDQLGTTERNQRYKELYGTLFNSATIAFYWKQLEMEEGKLRFEPEWRDSEFFWNNCPQPWMEPHWRRPPTDTVVNFCLSKGIRLHGHPLVWGNNRWQIPDWLIKELPEKFRKNINLQRGTKNGILPDDAMGTAFHDISAKEMEDAMPEYTSRLNTLTAKRIMEIALRYGDKIDSWDVVNESAKDYENGNMIPGSKLCKSWYGPMPGDYTYRSFKIAESVLPGKAKLNINDYNTSDAYLEQVNDLKRRGCKIDIIGSQMHLFDPQTCQDIADGKSTVQSPAEVLEVMNRLSKANLPIHLSEITITAPGGDRKGEIIQAEITRNLYRLWFSIKQMMGITWWNTVDNCGAPGEPSVSGTFTRDMEPKLAYFTLDELINKEWRTNTECIAEKDGSVSFRGFRGNYRLSWDDDNGNIQTVEKYLN